MSSQYFKKEVIITEAVHPRHHPNATQHPDDRLEVVTTKYTPISNPNPGKNDLTIVLMHANGFHTELYEGFLDEIILSSSSASFKIRAIYAFQCVNQGSSGLRNEEKLGDRCK